MSDASNTYCAILITIVMVMVSCKPAVPDKYIQPDELEDILYDYYISQALASHGSTFEQSSYNKSMYYSAVLKKHGVTESELDSSLVYYYTNADRMFEIYKHLSERMSNEAVGLGASVGEINKYSQFKSEGDTANIWHEATSAVLMPVPPYDKIIFCIKADSTFKRGDSFLFNFMSDYLYQTGTKDATLYIAMHYKNDSISTHVNHVSVSGISQLRIPANRDDDVKEINGFIYLNRGNDDSKTLKLMFVSQIQFIRFHNVKQQGEIEAKDSLKAKRDEEKPTSQDGPVLNTSRDTMTGQRMRVTGLHTKSVR